MDPDVLEIPPPIFKHPRRFKKQKQSIIYDVIDIVDDNENDDDDLMILGEITPKHSKGKAAEALREGYGDNHQRGVEKSGKVSGIGSSSGHDRRGSHRSFDNGDYLGLSSDEYIDVDEYALLQGAGSSGSFHSNFVGHDGSLHPSGVESGYLWSNSSYSFNATPKHVCGSTSALKSARDVHNGAAVALPQLTIIDEAENETLRKLRSFKQFDTVIDTSDHHFINHYSSTKQNPKSWAKQIQEEWKILEKHLPDTIFVRVYESRMDLMRAVIIGAEGTPYHNGLFFFDIFFPSGYPNVPPNVHYHSGGLRLNPNLYNCGKVCLSLLNTWSGTTKERWTKGVSTMLQVLVSIQGLILNTMPYYNEPGYESLRGTPNGETQARQYNQNTFILSLRTMMYTIRKPPKNFEDLVAGHFYSRAHDILASCKAYEKGVQVGCLVKGGVRDVDGSNGKNCPAKFKSGLVECVPSLIKEFENVGVKDCEKFTSQVRRSTTSRK
ncbi:putative ubiquitin-conjugating enzyme E2 38 isoform X2 [Lathyrus oleraceus]|uniref:putative ubiquitin-conjugating enzyme E2 38 isoform X2 n=1 Tax=Pisum sativum TaxID=3888 RepID=UPI0021D1AC88|nr:putative ubiquitin-conjugating enzyme E2 38 isoform X2 [Pisum sativum]